MEKTEQQKQSKSKSRLGKLSPAVKMTLLNIVSTPLVLLTLFLAFTLLFCMDSPGKSGSSVMFVVFLIGSGSSLLLTFLSGLGLVLGYKELHDLKRKETIGKTIYLCGCVLHSMAYFFIGVFDLVYIESTRLSFIM